MNITNTKARVWGISKHNNKKNTLIVKLSTFEGKDMNNNNKYSNWIANFVGDAYQKALIYMDEFEPFNIKLEKAKIENVYIKETQKTYYDVIVFDFSVEKEQENINNDEVDVLFINSLDDEVDVLTE